MKSALRAFKNEWNDYCEGERIVRELTSNDDEKPMTEQLQRLVYLITAEPENYQRTYMMIMRRVTDHRYIRHIEKGLIAVEYLIKYADQRFARSCKVHLKHFQKLKRYTYDLYGVDYGGNVRRRAARISSLLENDDELQEARAKAQGLPGAEKKRKSSEISKNADKETNKTEEDKNIKPSSAKKKKKKEEKDDKKPKEQLAPAEDLLDLNFTSIPQTNTADISSDHWLEDFAVDKQENSGMGDDGGQFGFQNDEEDVTFDNDDNKEEQLEEEDLDASDAWLTNLTQLNNPLQEVQKPQKKLNKKGKTMNQMQSKEDDLTGTFDDNFLQTINAGLGGQTTSTQQQQQPIQPIQPVYTSDQFSVFGNGPVMSNPSTQPLYGNYATPSYVNPSGNLQGFGYSPQPTAYHANPTAGDPFMDLLAQQTNRAGNTGQTTRVGNTGGPVPATYQKPEKK